MGLLFKAQHRLHLLKRYRAVPLYAFYTLNAFDEVQAIFIIGKSIKFRLQDRVVEMTIDQGGFSVGGVYRRLFGYHGHDATPMGTIIAIC